MTLATHLYVKDMAHLFRAAAAAGVAGASVMAFTQHPSMNHCMVPCGIFDDPQSPVLVAKW